MCTKRPPVPLAPPAPVVPPVPPPGEWQRNQSDIPPIDAAINASPPSHPDGGCAPQTQRPAPSALATLLPLSHAAAVLPQMHRQHAATEEPGRRQSECTGCDLRAMVPLPLGGTIRCSAARVLRMS